MFEPAIQAAASAARGWAPERVEQSDGVGCCRLCLQRYRVLVLDGPLRDLPHAVAHPAVRAVDDIIAARLDATAEQFAWDAWTVLLDEDDRRTELRRRTDAAFGGLLLVALEELGAADAAVSELRRCFIEPAMTRLLAHDRMDEVPNEWV